MLIGEKLRRLGLAAERSQELADGDREARDAAIEEADIAGFSPRDISHMLGTISHARVHKIVIERTAARQQRQLEAAKLA